MGRSQNWRRVSFLPEVSYFRPADVPLGALQEVCITVDEAEAIRLKDVEWLEQEECAESMRVSRPTFGRILTSGRRKLADALLTGKAIRIEGGNFEMAMRRFRCLDGHEWDVPFEAMVAMPPQSCPTCSTPNILPVQPDGLGSGGWGRQRHRRRGGRW